MFFTTRSFKKRSGFFITLLKTKTKKMTTILIAAVIFIIYQIAMGSKINFNKNLNHIWNENYIDIKKLFVLQFNAIPSIIFIGEIDTTKAFNYINTYLNNEFKNSWQHNYFDNQEGEILFNNTILELSDKRFIEIGAGFIQVFYTQDHNQWANDLIYILKDFKVETTEKGIIKVVGFAKEPVLN